MNEESNMLAKFPTFLLSCGMTVALLLAGGCGQTELPTASSPDLEKVAKLRAEFSQGIDQSASQTEETAAGPSGYATLRGTFRINGDPPPPRPLAITKDQTICAPGGKTVYSEDLVVDPQTKGIANIALWANDVPLAWIHESAKPGRDDEIIFDQKECLFLTHVVGMQRTQKLRVLNSDPVGHNLLVGSFNQTIPAGGFTIYQPLKATRAPESMKCSIHPWMQAYLLVRDDSYFAVTQPDGSFEIPNLPAGVKLDLRVWQERIGSVTEVTVNGEPAKWSKGRMPITLTSDTELEIVIDASLFQ